MTHTRFRLQHGPTGYYGSELGQLRVAQYGAACRQSTQLNMNHETQTMQPNSSLVADEVFDATGQTHVTYTDCV